ncbi:MAG: hypothetical protein R3E08_01285 [Thiotrichaceae bacterium]
MTIAGDIHVSLLPLSLEFNKVQLNSPNSFKQLNLLILSGQNFISNGHRYWRKKLSLTPCNQWDTVNITRQTDGGKVNWKNLLATPNARAPTTTPSLASQGWLKSLKINEISVSDSQIVWDDRLTKTYYRLKNLNFSTQVHADLENSRFQLNTVKIASELEHTQNKQPISLTIPQIQLDISQQKLTWDTTALQVGTAKIQTQLQVTKLLSDPTYHAELQVAEFNPSELLSLLDITNAQMPKTAALGVQMEGSLTGDNFIKNLAAKADDYQLQLAEAKFNLGNQTLETDNLKLRVFGNDIGIHFKGTELLNKPNTTIQIQGLGLTLNSNLVLERKPNLLIRGNLKLDKLDVRALAALLKQQLPETTDKKVLSSLALDTQVEANTTQADFHHVNITLDESVLKGDVQVQNFQQPALSFNLNLDNIDVDRYLPPKKSGKATDAGVPIPMDLLKKLNVNGMLKITNFKMAKMQVKEMNLKFVTQEGKVKVSMLNLLPDFVALLDKAKSSSLAKLVQSRGKKAVAKKIQQLSPLLETE